MPYGFTCDGQLVDECDGEYEDVLPAFMGEIRESWFMKTRLGGVVADLGYSPGQTVTFCGPCLLEVLR